MRVIFGETIWSDSHRWAEQNREACQRFRSARRTLHDSVCLAATTTNRVETGGTGAAPLFTGPVERWVNRRLHAAGDIESLAILSRHESLSGRVADDLFFPGIEFEG